MSGIDIVSAGVKHVLLARSPDVSICRIRGCDSGSYSASDTMGTMATTACRQAYKGSNSLLDDIFCHALKPGCLQYNHHLISTGERTHTLSAIYSTVLMMRYWYKNENITSLVHMSY